MKIAIFGGAFNPVHREHVNLARAAVKELGLDKLIIMPTAQSPHKSGKLVADFWQRFEMCRLAFSEIPQAEVSNYELTRGGISYTYLTCGHFAELYKDAERYFIIGADMLENFPQWKNPQAILEKFSLAACAREDGNKFNEYKERVEEAFNTRVAVIPFIGEKVSSTAVRTLAALGEDFGGYVNADVCQYICENGLYSIDKIKDVKSLLKPARYRHTVNVAVLCAKNAARAGITERQAVTMGALHDCTKNLPPDSPLLSGFIRPYAAPPAIMHQYSGAYLAEKLFGVEDKTVLSAIACHTTGKEGMTLPDALLYLCDMLEENRTFSGVEELRALFKKNIRLCLQVALKRQVEYLTVSGEAIDENTLKAYNYIKDENYE